MLSWAVMISLCHAVMRLPGYLSWNVPFDGAAVRPITEELSSYIHALPAQIWLLQFAQSPIILTPPNKYIFILLYNKTLKVLKLLGS